MSVTAYRFFLANILFVFSLVLAPPSALEAAGPRDAVPGTDLFTNGAPLHIRIEIPAAGVESLRKDRRKAVSAVVTEGTNTYAEVAVHLKGAAGSFRAVDDKPAFTLNFGKSIEKQRFHGLRKIHLNNSVQDPSYLNELLAADLFMAAGVPATRATHALVEFSGRKLGFYVLKEGFTKDFLKVHFKKTHGNLYDMEPGREVTAPLERDSGDGPEDRSDLQALATAAQEPDLRQRWQRLNETLDLDRFISFMAMEVMTCHWDGYCLAPNNFRIYHDMDSDRMVFLPHGTDQLFDNPGAPMRPRWGGLVARAVMRTPEGRRRYVERFRELATNLFRIETLTNRVSEVVAAIKPVLAQHDAAAAQELENQAGALRDRLARRGARLLVQIHEPEPTPLAFTEGWAKLSDWETRSEQGNAQHHQPRLTEKLTLQIDSTGSQCIASWRKRVLLEAGNYRLEGRARAQDLDPQRSESGIGGGLRISGGKRENHLDGTTDWRELAYEFAVSEGGDEVELVCELRANKGAIWFDAESLRLVRVK